MTRAQIVGLMGLAMSLPVTASFEVTMPNEEGDCFVKATDASMPAPEGKEPLWRLPRNGGCEVLRPRADVPSENSDEQGQ